MSEGKYVIMYARYPWHGCWDGSFATDWLVAFMFVFVVISLKYPIVDAEYRNHGKMGS